MYLTPQLGGFLVELVLAEKAVNAAQALDLPGHVLKLIDDAPRYSEGRGFRVPVKSLEDVAAVELLAAAKMAG